MINANHLIKEIIRPVLADLGLGGGAAEAQVFGTACKESACGLYLIQLGRGPALGIYQMEPATHDDIWDRFLAHQPDLSRKLNRWRAQYGNGMGPGEMVGNLYYATAMCRIHYLRVSEPLPETLPGQADYWKKYYNTPHGAGTEQEYLDAWRQFAPSAWV